MNEYIISICKQNHELQQLVLELMAETKQLKYLLLLHIYGKEGEGKELLERWEGISGMSLVKSGCSTQDEGKNKAKVRFQEA